jgi:hypothetical protein
METQDTSSSLYQALNNDKLQELELLYKKNKKVISFFKEIEKDVLEIIAAKENTDVLLMTQEINTYKSSLSQLKLTISISQDDIPKSLLDQWDKKVSYITTEMSIGEVDSFIKTISKFEKKVNAEKALLKTQQKEALLKNQESLNKLKKRTNLFYNDQLDFWNQFPKIKSEIIQIISSKQPDDLEGLLDKLECFLRYKNSALNTGKTYYEKGGYSGVKIELEEMFSVFSTLYNWVNVTEKQQLLVVKNNIDNFYANLTLKKIVSYNISYNQLEANPKLQEYIQKLLKFKFVYLHIEWDLHTFYDVFKPIENPLFRISNLLLWKKTILSKYKQKSGSYILQIRRYDNLMSYNKNLSYGYGIGSFITDAKKAIKILSNKSDSNLIKHTTKAGYTSSEIHTSAQYILKNLLRIKNKLTSADFDVLFNSDNTVNYEEYVKIIDGTDIKIIYWTRGFWVKGNWTIGNIMEYKYYEKIYR